MKNAGWRGWLNSLTRTLGGKREHLQTVRAIRRTRSRRLHLERLEDRIALATNITVIATGVGTLDHFLSASNGTITTADDPGDTVATLSAAALQGVGSGVNISIAADNSISFQDLGSLNLKTGTGSNASFTTTSGAISFVNPANTIATAGGSLTLSAGADLTVSNLNVNGDVSLKAGGAISQGASSIVTAAALTLSASTGIGTNADPIQTQISTLGADTSTGGIYINNNANSPGALAIAGNDGVQDSGASGDIVLTNAGTVNLLTSGDDIFSNNGSVTVTATGAASDVVVNAAGPVNTVILGGVNVTVQAGHDILVGSTTVIDAIVSGSGLAALTAGRDVILDNGAEVGAAFGRAGSVAVNAGRNLTLQATTTQEALIATSGGSITLATGPGGVFTLNSGSGGEVSSAKAGGNGPITISADDMVLNDSINAGTGVVALQQATGGLGATTRNIDLGGGTTAGDLGLSDADLGMVTASVLHIGRADNPGNITVTAPVTAHTGFSTLDLISGGTISESGTGAVTVVNLDLQGAGGVNMTLNASDVSGNLSGSTNGQPFAFADSVALTVDTVDTQSGISTLGGVITLAADDMTINAPVSAGAANVNLLPESSGRSIDLGLGTTVNELGLSDADLAEITAGQLTIGDSTAGDITLTANVTAHAGFNNLELITGGGIVEGAGSLAVMNLALSASSGIGAASPLLTAVTNLAFSNLTSGAVQISNTGDVTIQAIDAILTSTNKGTTTNLTAAGALTFAVNVASHGTLTAQTTESANETPNAPEENITVKNGAMVGSTAGGVTFLAADNFAVPAGAVQAFQGAVLTSGVGDNDNDATPEVEIIGGAGANSLVVTATASDSGTYSLNGGPAIVFSNITLFTFTGGSGDNKMTVNNPASGLFAPSAGVFFNGSGGANMNSLNVQGGAAVSETFTYAANAMDGGHDGAISLVKGATTASYTYTELSPILVNAGTPQNAIFNLPSNSQDNEAVIESSGTPGMLKIVSQNGGFETTTFAAPSVTATINASGSVGQTINASSLPGGAVLIVNGGGASKLNFDAQHAPIGTALGRLASQGVTTALYSGIAGLNLNNAAGVDAVYGPNTADRSTAFIGLSADERFVQAMYLDALGRAGSKAELDGWAALFGVSGMSQRQAQTAIGTGIEHSVEANDHLVKSWYATFLGRQAHGGEENGWVGLLQQGQSDEQVLSMILATSEFYSRAQTLSSAGTADQRYVQALYLLLLNRTADASGEANFVAALPSLGRQGVALSFMTGQAGQEFRTDQFEGYYNALLHRPADSAGLNSWVISNLDMASVRIDFETTPEFFTRG